MPLAKLMPIRIGLAPVAFDSGSTLGSSTRTIETWRLVLVAVSVKVRLTVLPGSMFDTSRSKPALGASVEGAAVPAVVVSDSALAIDAASWSTCVCACTSVVSRSVRSAAICPDLNELDAIMSIDEPFASLHEIVPTEDLVGSACHCEFADSVPCELKVSCEACRPTSSTPLDV